MSVAPTSGRLRRIRIQILQRLSRGSTSVYALITAQDACLPEFYELLDTMQRGGLITLKGGKATLTDAGEVCCQELGIVPIGELNCAYCEGTGLGVNDNDRFAAVLEEYRSIATHRPPSLQKFDQGFISLEGVIRRVELMHQRGDLAGADIFVVGDDDLLSIAAGLTGLPKSIVVTDIDERLVDFINSVARDLNLPARAFTHDVRSEYPEDIAHSFDVFVTDPVETLPGLRLFLSRGVSTLKGVGCSGYFGLTHLEASSGKWYAVQQMILDMGFVLTDVKRDFNVYPRHEKSFSSYEDTLPIVIKLGGGVDYDWFQSSLIRMEAVRMPSTPITGEHVLEDQIYRDDETWATADSAD